MSEKSKFERKVFGIPLNILALLLGGLLAERKISGSASIAAFLAAFTLSKE